MANTVFDLVFEGGGAKGAVFIGALEILERHGFSPGLLVGTSAGAITATMLAAGYRAKDMVAIARERTAEGLPRFSSFLDPPTTFSDPMIAGSDAADVLRGVSLVELLHRHVPALPGVLAGLDDRLRMDLIRQTLRVPAARSIFSFIERGGLYEGTRFLSWVQEKLDAILPGSANDTLFQFHQRTKRELTLVASDVSGEQMLVLNHLTAPNCPVAWAVRMSMSIPLLWQEIVWDSTWGAYENRNIAGHVIVDGGVLSNFPLHLIVPLAMDTTKPVDAVRPSRVLGLLIDETLEVPGAPEPQVNKSASAEQSMLNRIKIVHRIRRLIDTMSYAHDKEVIAKHANLVCQLPAKGYGTTEFDMSDARMEALITAGRDAMSKLLA
jgi:NTE family protein